MNGLRPMMSVTENIMVMSLVPTHGPTLPDAMVETMILGNPYGSSRITAVAERRALRAAEGHDGVDLSLSRPVPA